MNLLRRHPGNPIITPATVSPSTDEFRVVGAFNPAAVLHGNETLLLLRVAEACVEELGTIGVPIYDFDNGGGRRTVARFRRDDPNLELRDTRGIRYRGKDYLSSLSHIRLARSADGVRFAVDTEPFIYPTRRSEAFGVEDARISRIGESYFINYTGVSEDGYATLLASTEDFRSIEKKGIIFPPLNKDVALFPELIGGYYYALHRPHNQGFGRSSIWISRSPDLVHWGDHRCLLRPRENSHERNKIGGGAPPVKTKEGWLTIYHGNGEGQRYTLNTLLLDLEDPRVIRGQGPEPCLEPSESYETDGFFGNVVFTNGMTVRGEVCDVYYGAGDASTCLASARLTDLVDHALGKGVR